jgi:plastocyanin
MVNQYVWVGIAVGVFVAGQMQQTMQDPDFRHNMMNQFRNNPQSMQNWMSPMMNDPELQSQMRGNMMQNSQFMQGMMGPMSMDPELREQMLQTMMNNPQMMEQMQQMMGSGNMMMGGQGMMGGGMMMNQEMMNRMMSPDTISNPSTVIPSNAEPQVRSFDIELGEVEFFANTANTENEEGAEDAVFVELHRWSPNTIVVNKGDTVVLKVTNPRGNYHSFSIPEFGVSTSMLDPRGGTETVEFVADKTGTFTFSCEVPYNPDKQWCDPDHAMMTGTLIVLDSGE